MLPSPTAVSAALHSAHRGGRRRATHAAATRYAPLDTVFTGWPTSPGRTRSQSPVAACGTATPYARVGPVWSAAPGPEPLGRVAGIEHRALGRPGRELVGEVVGQGLLVRHLPALPL